MPEDIKTIAGKPGVFRLRIEGFRMLYRINYERTTIIIVKIDKRSKVYACIPSATTF